MHRLAARPGITASLIAAALVTACATPPMSAPTTEPDRPGVVVPEASTPGVATERPSAARGRLKAMPVRPLNVKTDCRFKDEAGYGASAVLDVAASEVRSFAATVNVPKRGSCRFDLADFRQVRREPHVELRAGDGCTVRMWEQGNQVTVAFAECAKRCTRDTFDYVWPILVDRPSGRCS